MNMIETLVDMLAEVKDTVSAPYTMRLRAHSSRIHSERSNAKS
jgi:hypothetical protein